MLLDRVLCINGERESTNTSSPLWPETLQSLFNLFHTHLSRFDHVVHGIIHLSEYISYSEFEAVPPYPDNPSH